MSQKRMAEEKARLAAERRVSGHSLPPYGMCPACSRRQHSLTAGFAAPITAAGWALRLQEVALAPQVSSPHGAARTAALEPPLYRTLCYHVIAATSAIRSRTSCSAPE